VVVEWGEGVEDLLGGPSLVVRLAMVAATPAHGEEARSATLSGPRAFGIVL
jgi:hypothetical protein